MKKIFLLCCLISIFSITNAQTVVSKPKAGTTGSWRLLGSVTASHNADHDVIVVAGPHDYFRKLKFKVTNSPVKMQRMVVTYDDGALPEKIDTRFDIPKGGESRIIDLKGFKRKIKTIEFWYDTKGIMNGRAEVTVFGMK
ncbi:MAG TPA: hypothetical protein PLA68_16605 [Panacibacter sp.]|nr:hypothetical protein [Panacibacter sp.]